MATALLKGGVPSEILRAEAAGADAPVAPNETDEGRANVPLESASSRVSRSPEAESGSAVSRASERPLPEDVLP